MPLRVLFLDLNAYFASVEQQERPELRGRCVAVIPVEAESTCCIAVSYPARKFGVKTGTMVADARRLCPELITVPSRTEVYVRYHHQIVEAVTTCLPVAKVWSIDEMECRLLGQQRERTRALALAEKVKAAIRNRVGECLTSSIGLAANRLLAKTASDMQKPDGLTCLEESDLPHRLYTLKLTDFSGIGPRMERRLNAAGIYTVEQLLARSEKELVRAWGSVVGRYWWHALRGEEVYEAPPRTRSMGHEHVLPPELRTMRGARGVLVKLIAQAAARARSEGYLAGSLLARIRFSDRSVWLDRAVFSPPTHATLELLEAFARLWTRQFGSEARGTPCKVATTLLDLQPEAGAMRSLFAEDHRRERVSAVMDQVNARYGSDTVYPGAMLGYLAAAPARIAFGNVPEIERSGQRLKRKPSDTQRDEIDPERGEP